MKYPRLIRWPALVCLLTALLGLPNQAKRDTLVVMSGNGDLALRQGQWKYIPDLAVAGGWNSAAKKTESSRQARPL